MRKAVIIANGSGEQIDQSYRGTLGGRCMLERLYKSLLRAGHRDPQTYTLTIYTPNGQLYKTVEFTDREFTENRDLLKQLKTEMIRRELQ